MIGQIIASAFQSLWTKKTRSVLTMLGVIIGVAQIIALIGLGNGIKKDISSEITQLGTNVLFVIPGKVQTASGGFNPAGTGFWPAIASPVVHGGIAVVPVGRDDDRLAPVAGG